MTADLAEVRAALAMAEQATPGPWRTFGQWPHLAVVSGSGRPRIVASLASASDAVDDTPEDAAAIVALRNAAPAIAAAVEELEDARAEIASAREQLDRLRSAVDEREGDMHMRIRAGYDKTVADAWRAAVAKRDAEIAALNRQVCRLVSGHEIDGDRLCQHHGADVAALALLSDERAAHAETSRDLDALLTALGAQVTPGGQTFDACHARRVADGLRLARELVADREVPADVEAAIRALVDGVHFCALEIDDPKAAEGSPGFPGWPDMGSPMVANLRAAIAAEIERARAEGRAESPAAPPTVGGLLATAPIGAFVEWLSEDHEGWCRTTVGQSQMVISRWFEYPPKWTRPGFGMYPGDLRLPARLVPAAEADADPAGRGPIGGGS